MRTHLAAPGRRRRLSVLAVALVVALGLAGCGTADDVADDTTATVAEPTTTTTAEPTTTTVADAHPFALWPDLDGDVRFDDPVDAARSFAVDLVGFTDPVLGPFQAGDSRSGEVELRSFEGGPVSTVLVRQLTGDDSWWVIAANHEDILIEEPQPQSAVDDPLQLSGQARAFEGNVQVSIFSDGSTTPIGEGFVTGSGGPDLGPFQGEVPFASPGGGWGALVLYTESAEDGRVLAVTAIRMAFIGGD